MDLMSEFAESTKVQAKPKPKPQPPPQAPPPAAKEESSDSEPLSEPSDDYSEEDESATTDMFDLVPEGIMIQEGIKFFVSCNSTFLTGTLKVCYVQREELIIRLELTEEGNISYLHMDPRGLHIIMCSTNSDVFYANVKEMEGGAIDNNGVRKGKFKLVKSVKGQISAVGWDKNKGNSSVTTGQILVGTTKGSILEMRLPQKEKEQQAPTKLFNLADQQTNDPCITGIEVELFPGSMANKMFIMVTTRSRLYQFTGGPTFRTVFDEQNTPHLQEMPEMRGEMPGSLALWRNQQRARTFAWLAVGPGIVHGRLSFPSGRPDSPSGRLTDQEVVQDTKMIDYVLEGKLIGVAISEYHFFCLYETKLVVLGHPPGLSWSHAQLKRADVERRIDFVYNFQGRAVGITRDAASKMVYVFTSKKVFEITARDEERNVWGKFLERAMDPKEREREAYFTKALKLCATDNSPQARQKREQVLAAKGNYHLECKDYVEAARVYAKTNVSFEDTCLNLLQLNQREALLEYLLQRLEFMLKRSRSKMQEQSQFCSLCTWVVEMYLDKLNKLTEEGELQDEPVNPDSIVHREEPDPVEEEDQRQASYNRVAEEFCGFLRKYSDYLDSNTTLHLISSHGRIQEVLFFAEIIEDFERVITHHIVSNQDFNRAIGVLTNKCIDQKFESLWYRFSPVLIQQLPAMLVEGWMMEECSEWLQPAKLIPALVKYDPKLHNRKGSSVNQAIRYLEWLINHNNNTDMAMHNMLLSFYAKEEAEGPLLDFLQRSSSYDPKYALRLCLEAGRTLACVHIYSHMGLYDDAVRTALLVKDLKLAKYNADLPTDDPQLRKKLWLDIAKYILQNDKIKDAIGLLQETSDIKLEDILPFFKDSVPIQMFKTEICQSLESYNSQILELRGEMDEATRNADAIRTSIKELRNRFGYVTSSQPCDLCHQPALSRDFFLFPNCRHLFHKNCLSDEIKRHVPAANQMSTEEFEELVVSECVFCSDITIDSIDQILANEDSEAATWALPV